MTLSATWYTPPEDGLPPRSPAAEVEKDIWAMIDPHFYMQLSEFEQRGLLRALCRDHGWAWSQVARVMRHKAIAAQGGGTDDEPVEFTNSGIPIYPARFAGPSSLCPFKRRFFHLGFWEVRHRDKLCNSLSEQTCAPKAADQLLRTVDIRIRNLTEVHIAEAKWEKGLSNLMGQRRSNRKVNTFTYRSVDDTVTFVSDGPIGGRKAPTTSTAVTPAGATDWIIPRLWVPGHHSHRFSDGWKFPENLPDNTGIHISLDGLSDDRVSEFQRRADAVKARYGVEPDVPLPPEDWPGVRSALLKIVDDLRKQA